MMTREMVIAMLKDLGNDVDFYDDNNNIDVTINDFEGFDENWAEIIRDLDNAEGIDKFIEMLEDECISYEGDMTIIYHFKDFDVTIRDASFEI